MECKFCEKICKNSNSLKNHERLCRSNPDRAKGVWDNPDFYKTRKTSNQYLAGTAKPYEEVYNADKKQRLKEHAAKYWSEEKRKEHSERMKIVMQKTIQDHPESYSYKNFCGRSKKSFYGNQIMHSSWELLVAKWFDSLGIKWTKKVEPIQYFWNGSNRKFFPDFYLEEFDMLVEVKGYETDRDAAKWSGLQNLVVLKEKEIKLLKRNELSPDILRGRELPS